MSPLLADAAGTAGISSSESAGAAGGAEAAARDSGRAPAGTAPDSSALGPGNRLGIGSGLRFVGGGRRDATTVPAPEAPAAARFAFNLLARKPADIYKDLAQPIPHFPRIAGNRAMAECGIVLAPAAPVLIICPTSLVWNWLRELNQWGWFKVARVDGGCGFSAEQRIGLVEAAARGEYEVVLTSHHAATLSRDVEADLPGASYASAATRTSASTSTLQGALQRVLWGMIVVDEAHCFRNPKTKSTAALRSYNARSRLLLTGTPMQNSYADALHLAQTAYPLLRLQETVFVSDISKPIDDGRRKAAAGEVAKNAAKAERSFARQFWRPLFLHRLKSAVLASQLPQKRERVLFCVLSPLQEALYKAVLLSKDCVQLARGILRTRLVKQAEAAGLIVPPPYLPALPGALWCAQHASVDDPFVFTYCGGCKNLGCMRLTIGTVLRTIAHHAELIKLEYAIRSHPGNRGFAFWRNVFFESLIETASVLMSASQAAALSTGGEARPPAMAAAFGKAPHNSSKAAAAAAAAAAPAAAALTPAAAAGAAARRRAQAAADVAAADIVTTFAAVETADSPAAGATAAPGPRRAAVTATLAAAAALPRHGDDADLNAAVLDAVAARHASGRGAAVDAAGAADDRSAGAGGAPSRSTGGNRRRRGGDVYDADELPGQRGETLRIAPMTAAAAVASLRSNAGTGTGGSANASASVAAGGSATAATSTSAGPASPAQPIGAGSAASASPGNAPAPGAGSANLAAAPRRRSQPTVAELRLAAASTLPALAADGGTAARLGAGHGGRDEVMMTPEDRLLNQLGGRTPASKAHTLASFAMCGKLKVIGEVLARTLNAAGRAAGNKVLIFSRSVRFLEILEVRTPSEASALRVEPAVAHCSANMYWPAHHSLCPTHLPTVSHPVVLQRFSNAFLPELQAYLKIHAEPTGVSFVTFTGGLSAQNRQEVVTRFERDPDVNVMLISLKAGGVGLNLTAANVVLLTDPDWNPSALGQAADRAYRIGQTRDVTVLRLVSLGTMEEVRADV